MKTRAFLLLSVVHAGLFSTGKALNVDSGAINQSVTWTAEQSPIRVRTSVTILSGVTLTITPGVEIQFQAGESLTVADGGRMLAVGAEAAPIHFTKIPGGGTWDGLTINGGNQSPETRIEFAKFSANGHTAIHAKGAAVFLRGLSFTALDHAYLSLDDSSFVVSECHFPKATAPFELVHGTGGIRAGGHGIFQRNYFGSPMGYNDTVDFTGGSRKGSIVHFVRNVFNGSGDDLVDLDGTDAWIEGNIFLHCHRNGAPDSSAAVSGGNDKDNTSEVTVIGNLFFDCDNAATAKQGNFFTFFNNTIVHTTKVGGLDFASGVFNVQDTTPKETSFGKGFYVEGNIIADAEQLVRNYSATEGQVTFVRNLLPTAWSGPGEGNLVSDPAFRHVPSVEETQFSNWQEAQILREWLALSPGSAGLAAGPGGRDMGGVIPLGASLLPEQLSTRNATFAVGFNRSNNGIPLGGWPAGVGYVAYRWRLDGGAWSDAMPVAMPIVLTDLAVGRHQLDVSAQADSGLFQDDVLLGKDASISSFQWTVGAPELSALPQITLVERSLSSVVLQVQSASGGSFSIQYSDTLAPGSWRELKVLTFSPQESVLQANDLHASSAARFYRVARIVNQ